MAINRRKFLIGAGAVGGAVAAAGVTTHHARASITTESLWRLTAALPESASARDIGVEYLRRFPDEALVTPLSPWLVDLAERLSMFGDVARLQERFRDDVRADFERGDVVVFGGWRLSRTSVRLCGLAVAKSQMASGISGVFAPQALPSGEMFSWLTPDASFRVPPAGGSFEMRLRSGARDPQTVAVFIDDDAPREVTISGEDWQSIGYVVEKRPEPTRLRLRTTPPWEPDNDFRTLGVGIAATGWTAWSRPI
jgi:hypothetical protein